MIGQYAYDPKDQETIERFAIVAMKEDSDPSELIVEFIKEFVEENGCETCLDTGEVEHRIGCGKVASMCCGGCIEDVPCPDCN